MRFSIFIFVLAFSVINISLAASPEPFEPDVCAISNKSGLLTGSRVQCTAYEGKISPIYYAEYAYMENENYFIHIITQLSGVNTGYSGIDNFKKKLASFRWIKEQNPKYKRSKE